MIVENGFKIRLTTLCKKLTDGLQKRSLVIRVFLQAADQRPGGLVQLAAAMRVKTDWGPSSNNTSQPRFLGGCDTFAVANCLANMIRPIAAAENAGGLDRFTRDTLQIKGILRRCEFKLIRECLEWLEGRFHQAGVKCVRRREGFGLDFQFFKSASAAAISRSGPLITIWVPLDAAK